MCIITVLFVPFIIYYLRYSFVLHFLCLDKPIIVLFASKQNKEIATIGDTVKIICKGVAFPPADYTLFHNETRLTGVVDGVKTISSACRNDAGKYVCVARNSLGNVSKSFFLSVNDVLQKPTTILTSTLKEINTKGISRNLHVNHRLEVLTKVESNSDQYVLFSIFKSVLSK